MLTKGGGGGGNKNDMHLALRTFSCGTGGRVCAAQTPGFALD